MLHVNDENNDELFRRAAENYPLQTDGADWNTVLDKINAVNAAAEPELITKKRKRNYRYLLLLLLLIPFAMYENKKYSAGDSTEEKNNQQGKIAAATDKPSQDNSGAITKNDPGNTASLPTNLAVQPATTNSADQVSSEPVANSKNNVPVSIANNQGNDNPVNPSTTSGKRNYSSKQNARINIKNSLATADDDNTGNNTVSPSASQKNPLKKKRTNSKSNIAISAPATDNDASTKNVAEPKEDDNAVVNTEKKTEPVASNASTNIASTKDATQKKKDEETIKTEPGKKEEAKKQVAKSDEKKAEKKDEKKEKQKRFYVGLIVGPDISAVKLQSVKKVGFGYGFVVGYKINSRLSVETGLINDKKYYNTDGKYFTKKGLPAYEKIEYVTGNCDMLELPISVRYSFSNKKHSGWFGSLGFSSYFMRHESYIYDLNYNGYIYPKAYSYNNKSTAFLAAINISAGYTYKFGKIGDLRLEPYLKLPINKIGTGQLPIQSAGFYLGFTKTIF